MSDRYATNPQKILLSEMERVSRDAADALPLETFKARLSQALSNLI